MHHGYLLRSTRDVRRRFGAKAGLQHFLVELLNRFVFFDCLHLIRLERETTTSAANEQSLRYRSRVASAQDLARMADDPRWEIDETKRSQFERGDACLISSIDGEDAGYTWVHSRGVPELLPGLVLSLPDSCLYNYAALTLPEFRGSGLQAYRHAAVLGSELWQDRSALIGYVRATNFASRRGQSRSGYRSIGRIWLLGSRRSFLVHCSRSLTRLGIHRIEPSRLATAGEQQPAAVGHDLSGSGGGP